MELKDKLLTQMTRRGLNGQKLARTSQVSDSEISRILAGKSRPGLENAFRLARAVGVSLDYLADDSLDVEPTPTASPLTAEEREALALAHGIGLTRASRILEIVRFVGYAIAMHRLLDAKPIIEKDDDDHAAAPPIRAPPRARRENIHHR